MDFDVKPSEPKKHFMVPFDKDGKPIFEPKITPTFDVFTLAEAMGNRDDHKLIVTQAQRELQRLRREYQELKELTAIWDAIDQRLPIDDEDDAVDDIRWHEQQVRIELIVTAEGYLSESEA